MTEQNENVLNEYDEQMYQKYESKIQEGNLNIGNWGSGDPKITNYKFLEKFNIKTLNLYIDNKLSIKFRNETIKELILYLVHHRREDEVLNLNVDDLELENLEVLLFQNGPNLQNYQLYNLSKFKKLLTLDVPKSNVDLTHIHKAISLTKLSMFCCSLKNIDEISSLTNLMILNISCNLLQTINSIRFLVNLKELNINSNKKIDITPLKDLVGLIKLDMSRCELEQLNTIKSLINLQFLDISFNSDINITVLQYLKNLINLNLSYCNLVSVCVLRPLVNLEELSIASDKIVYLDANLNQMKKLEKLRVNDNFVSDFSSIQQHKYFNQNKNRNNRPFEISNQKEPSKQELHYANKLRRIETPNTQQIEIQNKRKTLQTKVNGLKQEINGVIYHAYQNQIQFTENIAHLFQQLNQFCYE
ncbi:leucine-rich_repeat domain-containing protein [Hexamita inflata]|uniref:Leucine-rich repeat domain-containing protein n=1 Tax=Hexamita inflata TaxID=28002 RepID=A0AA86RQ25_9EUKA|nr:leucine-rich repeat domain-containing protein [Hexamita inflata]